MIKGQQVITEPARPEQQPDGSVLWSWTLASLAGNELQAMEQVTSIVQTLDLTEQRLARLQLAVAEATRNASEHGNQYRSDLVVTFQVLVSPTTIIVRIRDQGAHLLIVEPADLATRLAAPQTGRGWGLYLIKHLVDRWQFRNETDGHTIELLMSRQETGDDDWLADGGPSFSARGFILERKENEHENYGASGKERHNP